MICLDKWILSKIRKKFANLNRVIEKAVKKYTREVKLKKFPKINNFCMEQSLENKSVLKNRLINFYNLNKLKFIVL